MGRPAKGIGSRPTKLGAGLVLDNSIVMAWSFEGESSPFADTVLDALETTRAIVPGLWPLELANALLVGERRKRISQADSLKWMQILGTLPIDLDGENGLTFGATILNLARDQNLSAYDTAYLELAMRRGLPLATLDRKLQSAASSVGVPLFIKL